MRHSYQKPAQSLVVDILHDRHNLWELLDVQLTAPPENFRTSCYQNSHNLPWIAATTHHKIPNQRASFLFLFSSYKVSNHNDWASHAGLQLPHQSQGSWVKNFWRWRGHTSTWKNPVSKDTINIDEQALCACCAVLDWIWHTKCFSNSLHSVPSNFVETILDLFGFRFELFWNRKDDLKSAIPQNAGKPWI